MDSRTTLKDLLTQSEVQFAPPAPNSTRLHFSFLEANATDGCIAHGIAYHLAFVAPDIPDFTIPTNRT